MTNRLKIIFAGTPEISAFVLQQILLQYHVDLVLTQPDRPSGRGKKITFSAVKNIALESNIEILQPISLKNNQVDIDKIRDVNPDIIIVLAYGLILPKEVLNIPPLGCVNIHVSLLPKWRGAAPIQRAIIAGDDITGVTIMRMDEGLDTGDVLLQESIKIEDTDTSGSLHNALAKLGSKLILNYLKEYTSIAPKSQSINNISYAKKIDKSEAQINWQEDALTISRKIRGFNPSPGCYTYLNGKILKIWHSSPGDNNSTEKYGIIIDVSNSCITITCGSNTTLKVHELQIEGKNKQSAKQFITGHVDLLGTNLTTAKS